MHLAQRASDEADPCWLPFLWQGQLLQVLCASRRLQVTPLRQLKSPLYSRQAFSRSSSLPFARQQHVTTLPCDCKTLLWTASFTLEVASGAMRVQFIFLIYVCVHYVWGVCAQVRGWCCVTFLSHHHLPFEHGVSLIMLIQLSGLLAAPDPPVSPSQHQDHSPACFYGVLRVKFRSL